MKMKEFYGNCAQAVKQLNESGSINKKDCLSMSNEASISVGTVKETDQDASSGASVEFSVPVVFPVSK